MISIQHLCSKKVKDIPIVMPKNKHSHNQMLMETILLKGKDNSLFENVGPNAIVAERVAEVVYKEFYKHDFKWFTFSFEEGSNLIQFWEAGQHLKVMLIIMASSLSVTSFPTTKVVSHFIGLVLVLNFFSAHALFVILFRIVLVSWFSLLNLFYHVQ